MGRKVTWTRTAAKQSMEPLRRYAPLAGVDGGPTGIRTPDTRIQSREPYVVVYISRYKLEQARPAPAPRFVADVTPCAGPC